MSRAPSALVIWCNASFPPPALAELRAGVAGHQLLLSQSLQNSNLISGGPDPLLEEADVALGQPDPEQAMPLPRLRWAHLNSAGYTRYDTDEFRSAFRARGAILTNSSRVYDEPCAEHVFAMMLALARQLPQSLDDQRKPSPPWRAAEHRINSHLLTGQTALLLGFGAIGQRLAELLAPLRMNVIAVRRRVSGDEPIPTVTAADVDRYLPQADHVMNLLPASPATDRFLTAERIALLKPTAIVYNIGRGTTVDQPALLSALRARRIAAVYLDVTDPEPPPADDPVWTTPNCYITPHTAGGHADEFERLARHFLENLSRFERGEEMKDRIV